MYVCMYVRSKKNQQDAPLFLKDLIQLNWFRHVSND